jgi:hypothetical protein
LNLFSFPFLAHNHFQPKLHSPAHSAIFLSSFGLFPSPFGPVREDCSCPSMKPFPLGQNVSNYFCFPFAQTPNVNTFSLRECVQRVKQFCCLLPRDSTSPSLLAARHRHHERLRPTPPHKNGHRLISSSSPLHQSMPPPPALPKAEDIKNALVAGH